MDAFSKKPPAAPEFRADEIVRPSRAEAEAAVRTLIAWAGDNPGREGLLDTPRRVLDAYRRVLRRIRSEARRGSRPHLRGCRLL